MHQPSDQPQPAPVADPSRMHTQFDAQRRVLRAKLIQKIGISTAIAGPAFLLLFPVLGSYFANSSDLVWLMLLTFIIHGLFTHFLSLLLNRHYSDRFTTFGLWMTAVLLAFTLMTALIPLIFFSYQPTRHGQALGTSLAAMTSYVLFIPIISAIRLKQHRIMQGLTACAIVFSCILAVGLIWKWINDRYFPTFFAGSATAAFLSITLANLLSFDRLARILFGSCAILLAAVAATCVILAAVAPSLTHDTTRLSIAYTAGIVSICFTLYNAWNNWPSLNEPPSTVRGREKPYEFLFDCPACNSRLTIKAGRSSCPNCGLIADIRFHPGICLNCRYNMDGITTNSCPECGTSYGT